MYGVRKNDLLGSPRNRDRLLRWLAGHTGRSRFQKRISSFAYAVSQCREEFDVEKPIQYKRRTSKESEAMKKAKKKTKLPFSEQLKELIEGADMSRYRIAKDSGVPQSTLSSFVKGRRALSLMNIDRICELLDLELVPRKSTSTK